MNTAENLMTVVVVLFTAEFCLAIHVIKQLKPGHVGWTWGSWSPWSDCKMEYSVIERTRGCTKLSVQCWTKQLERRMCETNEIKTHTNRIRKPVIATNADPSKTSVQPPGAPPKADTDLDNPSWPDIPTSVRYQGILCPSGYVDYFANGRTATNGKLKASCYRITEGRKPWNEVRAECQASGGDLISIETQAEQSHVEKIIKEQGEVARTLWTSGSDAEEEGIWRWVATGKPILYSNWMPGQPDNGLANQHYLSLNVLLGMKWQDTYRSIFPYNGICESGA